jgi:hypothetical protein
MFERNGEPILHFRVYDGIGTCIEEYTGTLSEWNLRLLRGEAKKMLPQMLPLPEKRRWLH